jgi:hypothetical protein
VYYGLGIEPATAATAATAVFQTIFGKKKSPVESALQFERDVARDVATGRIEVARRNVLERTTSSFLERVGPEAAAIYVRVRNTHAAVLGIPPISAPTLPAPSVPPTLPAPVPQKTGTGALPLLVVAGVALLTMTRRRR